MTISSNSIFHFTQNVKSLNSILEDRGFKVGYCLEDYSVANYHFNYALPMVSFCDIPLSRATKHANSYGFYSIGLSKYWAKNRMLNPVMYLDQESILSIFIEPFIKTVFKNEGKPDIKFAERHIIRDNDKYAHLNAAIGILSFIKNHEGKLNRKGHANIQSYKYYDEREWRFVPVNGHFKQSGLHYTPFITPVQLEQWKKNDDGKFLPEMRLRFEPEDIDFIIVKEQNEISKMIDFLDELIYVQNINTNRDLLINKVMSFSDITSNF